MGELVTTLVVWGHSGGGAESGILKCGTTMVVWERSGGGAKGVVLEWGWSLTRICHHYGVLGTFRWRELRGWY